MIHLKKNTPPISAAAGAKVDNKLVLVGPIIANAENAKKSPIASPMIPDNPNQIY